VRTHFNEHAQSTLSRVRLTCFSPFDQSPVEVSLFNQKLIVSIILADDLRGCSIIK